jgi:nitrogenase molybdenum-iron protein NifN
VVRQFRDFPRHKNIALLTVNTQISTARWRTALAVVESVIEQWVPEKPQHGLRNRRVNLLLSHLLTPGDVDCCAAT